MNMKIAFSTNAFTSFSLPEAIRAIASAGYKGVEIMADIPHAYPPHMTPEKIAETRRAIAECGLEISNVNAFMLKAVGDFWHPSWIERDMAKREQRLRHTVDSLKLARSLGAQTVSTEAGGPLDGVDKEAARRWFEEGILHTLDAAERCCVKLLIEPEPGLFIENVEHVEEFFMRFRSPWLGLNFDVGHFFCVGADLRRAIRRLAPDIGHVHIEDIGADRRHHHLIPGRGAIDFGEVFDALRSIGYNGWVTVELYTEEANPVEAAVAALKYLRTVGC
jgi:sugar phosphate isomerase/epimerase